MKWRTRECSRRDFERFSIGFRAGLFCQVLSGFGDVAGMVFPYHPLRGADSVGSGLASGSDCARRSVRVIVGDESP